MVKAVIFFFYNTLLCYQSQEEKTGIWEMMAKAVEYILEKKLQIVPEELERLYQELCDKEIRDCQKRRGSYAEMRLRNVWRNVLQALDIPLEIAEEKSEDILLIHRLYARKKKRLFPNVGDELIKLKKNGMKLLLLSNAQTCFLYNELPEEIRNIFDEIIISEVAGIKKPDENIFCLAFEKLGVEPEHVVVVGDSMEDDIIPARKFGCQCIRIGKRERMKNTLSRIAVFDPYQQSGYAGLSELIVNMS